MVHDLHSVAPMLRPRLLHVLTMLMFLAAACVGDGGNGDDNDTAEEAVTALPRQGYASPSIPSKYSAYIKETTSGSWTLRVFSSIETAGVHMSSSTVDTSIKKLRLWYRALGASTWQRGHDFTGQITKTLATSSGVSHQPLELYVSSLFGLAADTDYEAKAELLDGSNQIVKTLTRTFRTQPDEHDFTPSQTLTVDKSAGPYTTIQSAINAATPGTRILVKPGVYREALSFSKSGGPNGQWIQLLADGPGVILDGSYANNADAVTGSWTQYSSSSAEWGDNLWRNNVASNLYAIWMGDVSLFRHVDTSYTPSG
ncbi:MAG TPA: hypothetical protein VFB62_06290, partial [Polyangiaceae bacterium]|nr:hypothetical protein [Polyangiaceae bacterium]